MLKQTLFIYYFFGFFFFCYLTWSMAPASHIQGKKSQKENTKINHQSVFVCEFSFYFLLSSIENLIHISSTAFFPLPWPCLFTEFSVAGSSVVDDNNHMQNIKMELMLSCFGCSQFRKAFLGIYQLNFQISSDLFA